MSNNLNLDVDFVRKILVQLIRSDGMKVSHQYLIDEHVYYIDNTSLIEELEQLLLEHYYLNLLEEKGNVNMDDLLDCYSPQFINYDMFYNKLEKKYCHYLEQKSKELDNNNLNKYF